MKHLYETPFLGWRPRRRASSVVLTATPLEAEGGRARRSFAGKMWTVRPRGACGAINGCRGPHEGSCWSTSDAAPMPGLPSGAQVSSDCGVLEDEPALRFLTFRKGMGSEDDPRLRSAPISARPCITCHGAASAKHFLQLPHRRGKGGRGGGACHRSKRHGRWRCRAHL